MLVAVLSDTHFGSRNDSVAFNAYFEQFYHDIFFPYLDSHGITAVLHLGDMFDRRKYINYLSLHNAKSYFFDQIEKRHLKFVALVGNHDSFYKNTIEVNSIKLILGEYDSDMRPIEAATEIEFDGCKILLVPWICQANHDKTMEAIKDTKAQICMGHLEIAGFEMYKGSISSTGVDRKLFDKFDIVASGHFHHKSQQDNIMYLGSTYEMNWADWDDDRGFHIFDTDTRTFEYIKNPYKMFHKLKYNDNPESGIPIDNDYTSLAGSYVKVVIIEKNNPYTFDLFIQKLEKAGVIDLQVVDDHKNLMLQDNDDILEGVEDTAALLTKFVELTDQSSVQKIALHNLLKTLYDEASGE